MAARELAADLGIGAHGERIEIDLTGSAENLAGLPPGAAELLGAAPQPDARGRRARSPIAASRSSA